MLTRRGVLSVLGGAATGIWMASTGLVRLDRHVVIAVTGSCSFCAKASCEVRTMLGTVDGTVRICDECVGMCVEIVREEFEASTYDLAVELDESAPPAATIHGLVQQIAASRNPERSEMLMAEFRARLTAQGLAPLTRREFRCSFCGAHRSDVAKLISGPGVFICDRCTGEAAALVPHVLRA